MRLKESYNKEILPGLAKDFGFKSLMAVPRLVKIVVSMGVADSISDKNVMDKYEEQLALITGQKPVRTKAKRSISSFKLREGEEIGLKVTLRGARMLDFLEKLVKVVFPRVRDFRGISLKSFDGSGNYSVGFTEQLVFPEIDPGKTTKIKGIEVTIVTNTRDSKKAQLLLEKLGMPFSKEN